jgi:antitoxin component YwqK of YwqJK toxin-antitoxin module
MITTAGQSAACTITGTSRKKIRICFLTFIEIKFFRMRAWVFISVFLCVSFSCFYSQPVFNPPEFSYNGKNYFVYPSRASDIMGIPPVAFELPDGDYVLFTEYEFSCGFLRREKLRDTTKVSAIFSIKNKVPDGAAVFYNYEYRAGNCGAVTQKKFSGILTGAFKNGLKEGEWVQTYAEKKMKTIRHFKGGLLNGYLEDYDRSGKITRREKYCDDRLCDTVFFYFPDGRTSISYDIYDPVRDSAQPPPANFIDFIFTSVFPNLFPFDKETAPKTFYRSWSYTGRAENNIRLVNGKNPVFDTLFSNEGTKLVVKKIREDKADTIYQAETFSADWKSGSRTIRIYSGHEEITNKIFYSDNKTKKADSLINYKMRVNKIDLKSWQAVNVNYYYSSKTGTDKTFLIPASGYCWTEKNGKPNRFTPVSVDSVNRVVYTRDTFWYRPSAVYKVRELKFAPYPDESAKNPKEKFKFLALRAVSVGNYLEEAESAAVGGTSCALCKLNFGQVVSEKYYHAGTPVTGPLLLSRYPELKKKNDFPVPVTFTDKIYLPFHLLTLTNGVRDGRVEIVKLGKKRKISGTPEKWFFTHANLGDSYKICSYSKGLLDGNQKLYHTAKVVTKNYNGDSTGLKISSRVIPYLFLDQEYSGGLPHGAFKLYYPTGKVQSVARYSNGKIDGRMQEFDVNGNVKLEVDFKNDSLNGEYSEFFDGKKIVSAQFRGNKLHGSYTEFNKHSGIPYIRVSAKENIAESKTLYFDNGKIKEELFMNPGSTAEFVLDLLGLESYLEDKKLKAYTEAQKLSGRFAAYFENGKTLCEGKIEEGKADRTWKFYNVAGTLINEVNFKDTIILFPNGKGIKKFIGTIKGFYNDGARRFTGFISAWESGYDCATHQDKTRFTITYVNSWNPSGEQIMKNGNGKGFLYDENGIKSAEGELSDYREEGVWKYFDPNQKLNETGRYVRGEKDGLWYLGDLENLNFNDAACFDANDPVAKKFFEYNKKQIKVSAELYKSGVLMDSETYETDLNKIRD